MAQSHNPSRRRFIKTLTAGTVGVGYISMLEGCGSGGGSGSVEGSFPHGVASGDPLSDRVILWTRLNPEAEGTYTLTWEVAEDEAFANVVSAGSIATSAERNYTVKVDADGLMPATPYFYRFIYEGTVSPVGVTRTLPTGSVSELRLAVFSCANFPAGFFNVYREAAARTDIDVAVLLGDYIYEYDAAGYASENAAVLGRVSEPVHECLTLQDYRARYSQYRLDGDLQALHHTLPVIAVWDDHEIANDTYAGGAENHDPATEGDFFARRDAAIQAYYEWMPIREQDPNQPERIYRSFDFGDLMSLHMLDTRVVGRDRQLDYADYIDPVSGAFDQASFAADLGDTNRQLLGAEQTAWLQTQMGASTARWQVLGQQILMGRMDIPAPIATQQIGFSAYSALLVKAQTDPTGLTAEEQAILAQPSIPYNLDAWDGYYVARETVLGTALAADKNLVVLAGDTHNAWANDLKDMNGNQVGVEFATSSVSSPGLEAYLPDEDPNAVAAGLVQLIDPLAFANTEHRGYMTLSVTPTEATAHWHFVNTVISPAYTTLAYKEKALKVLPGAGNRRIVAV